MYVIDIYQIQNGKVRYLRPHLDSDPFRDLIKKFKTEKAAITFYNKNLKTDKKHLYVIRKEDK